MGANQQAQNNNNQKDNSQAPQPTAPSTTSKDTTSTKSSRLSQPSRPPVHAANSPEATDLQQYESALEELKSQGYTADKRSLFML